MSFVVKKPGLRTTVQDLGRTGFQNLGLNPGGAMDRTAIRIVNRLLGNPDSAAVLESHFPACEIELEKDTRIAIGGADFDARLGDRKVRNWSSTFARRGETLRFAGPVSGQRAYVAFSGGIGVPEWLGSRSTNLVAKAGGHEGRALKSGDRLPFSTSEEMVELVAGPSLGPRYSRFPTVRIIAGPEFDRLTALSERDFLSHGFSITTECDRMGYRLQGKPLHLLHSLQMVSAGVTFGTIQLLPDGQLIVLMADHQTSGGYPRIGTVVSVDLPLLAQCGPRDGVGFKMVTIQEAEHAARQFEGELNFLGVGCRLLGQNAYG